MNQHLVSNHAKFRIASLRLVHALLFPSIMAMAAIQLACDPGPQPLHTTVDPNGHKTFFEHQTKVNGICINALAFSQDGRYLASLDNTGVLVLRDLGLKSFRRWQAHGTEGLALAFSPDGLQLASSGDPNTIAVWRVSDGSALEKITTKSSYRSLRFLSQGRIFACGWNASIDEWNFKTRKLQATWGPVISGWNSRDVSDGYNGSIRPGFMPGGTGQWSWSADPDGSRFLATLEMVRSGATDSGAGATNAGSENLTWILSREDMGPWHLWANLQSAPITCTTHNMRQTAVALDPPHNRFAYGNAEPFIYLVELP